MSTRRRLALLALAASAAVACNVVTGTGKYEIVDCPSGSCGDGGPNGDGPSTDDSAADAAVDTGDVPLPSCPSGRAPLRLTVTGTSGSVESNGGGLLVTAGSSKDVCLTPDNIDLRATANATWTGPSCKDGNTGRSRCEFDLGSAGLKVVAALP